MSILRLVSRCASVCALALVAACGGSSNEPDAYNGVIDGTALDAKFLANTAGAYPDQRGYANNKEFHFYNLGATRTSTMPSPIPVTVASHKNDGNGGAHVDNFPNSCTPGRAFNARTDAYATTRQAPIFDALPLATTTFNAIVWPVVAQYGVTGVTGETCNDIKDSRSIADAGDAEAGSFGARRSAKPNSYQLWAVINPTATVPALKNAIDSSFGPNLGWYKGMQLQFLNGGPIPTQRVQDPAFPNDPSKQIESLVVMEGIILDPIGTAFALPTADQAVLLPAVPGDEAYSPIVHLREFRLKTGEKLGDFKGVCGNGIACVPGLINITDPRVSAAFNTLFIASTPQP